MRIRFLAPLGIWGLALLVPLAAMIPTWLGYHFQEPPDRVFMGFRYMSDDHYQYAAFIRQAQDGGGLLMRNPFANEPQAGVFLLPLFWVMGALSRLLGGGVVFWWELFRLVGGALYVLMFWHLTGPYLQTSRQRGLATGLFCLGGGLDWIVTALRAIGVGGLDKLAYPFHFHWNWSTFGSMLMPNWIWPALLLAFAVYTAGSSSRQRALLLVVLLPLLWFVHPYAGMVGYLTFGLFPVVPLVVAAGRLSPLPWARARAHLRLALPALLSFLLVAPYLLWARQDLVFRLCSERGATLTDNFSVGWYPLCYGLLLPLAWFGARAMAAEASVRVDLLLAWLVAAVMLSVNPLYAGVKFQYLVFPPLALLAARGLVELHTRLAPMRRLANSRAAIVGLAAVLGLNSIFMPIKDLASTPDDVSIFMSAGELSAMKWLDGQPDGVVFSSEWTGNRIPWLSGKPVFVGHWFLSPSRDPKLMNVRAFFSPRVPAVTKLAILKASRARYVYVGPHEAPGGFDPTGLPLVPVYRADQHTIYEVRAERDRT